MTQKTLIDSEISSAASSSKEGSTNISLRQAASGAGFALADLLVAYRRGIASKKTGRALDNADMPDGILKVFHAQFQELHKGGITHWKGHPLVNGGTKRKRSRKPQQTLL